MTATVNDNALAVLPLIVVAPTTGALGGAMVIVRMPCPLRPVLASRAVTVTL